MSGQPSHPYESRLKILHGALETIDVNELVDAGTFSWGDPTLCMVESGSSRPTGE